MRLNKIILALLVACMPTMGFAVDTTAKEVSPKTVKGERVHVRQGNKLYEKKRYAEAEVEYRKALQANPASTIASFNLASSLIRQGGNSRTPQQQGQGGAADAKAQKNDPMSLATQLLENVIKTSPSKSLRSKSYYNLGNIAYKAQQYDKAIENYKNSLRNNPDDDQARDNLRLAQLKKQEQDKNKQNQDKNKDKQKQQQQKQQQQNNNNQNKQNQQQPKSQSNMSDQNVDQILKTMQNQEQATQNKVNASRARAQQNERRRTNNQW